MAEEAQLLKAEMAKVKAASLGEIILFAGKNMALEAVHPSIPAAFKGCLCVYKGIDVAHSLTTDEGPIHTTLIPNRNIELVLMQEGELYCPTVTPSRIFNAMTLFPGDRAYVGALDIASVLKREGLGYFDAFFNQYISKCR